MNYKNIFQFTKKKYVFGERPKVACILCETQKEKPVVPSLTIVESPHTIVSVNLYPYNAGHVLIYPKRHICDIRELTEEEDLEVRKMTKYFLDILDSAYHPKGYNIGYNLGEMSGASIDHIHLHIIPRFRNELGVIDLIGGAKVIVEDPNETKQILREIALKDDNKYGLKLW